MTFLEYVYKLHSNTRTRKLRIGQTIYMVTYRGVQSCKVKGVGWHARRYPGPKRGYQIYYTTSVPYYRDLQSGVDLVHTRSFAQKIIMAGIA